MEFILKHINKAYVITGKPQREERWDYPLDALREIVINMIIHRDYRSSNDSTIKIYDDRIEFFNPGTLLDDLTVEKIKSGNYKSHLRNKLIATIFKELKLVEKYGTGIRRVIKAFVDYGLPELEYEFVQGGLAVTIYNKHITGGVNELLGYIQSHPGQRTNEIAAALNLPVRTIQRLLKKLKDSEQIEFQGAPKTGGYYEKK
jgi:ATP-dependent DNA helicase RecG